MWILKEIESRLMIEIFVKLTPKASANRIGDWVELADGTRCLKVYVTAVPENNKANKALIALLAKHYKIPKSAIEIVQGATDRLKRLKINAAPNVVSSLG